MIKRILKQKIESKWADRKVLVIIGPRQVGKSTLLRQICAERGDYLMINGDDPEISVLLENAGKNRLKQIIGKYKIVFIDEAQRIPNIGLIGKIIYDEFPGVKLILSGSSAFEISNSVNEPLTGRKWELNLWQISWQELVGYFGFLDARTQLEQRLIYGMYPEVIMNSSHDKEVLNELASSYLYKDVLNLQNIRKPQVLTKLLRALAYQVGNEVNYNELSRLLQIDRATVEEYISLLEKTFIVFRLQPLSGNLRNEINSSRKVYFYDNGIRNAIIGDFSPMITRQDKGAVWENFIIAELKKSMSYKNRFYTDYFWRTYQQQEIDYILENETEKTAFEFKWNPGKRVKFPVTFTKNYPQISTHVIHPDNFTDFIN